MSVNVESRVGAVGSALAFHNWNPQSGSISWAAVICGLSFLVLYSVLRSLSLGIPVFSSHQKPIWFDLICYDQFALWSPQLVKPLHSAKFIGAWQFYSCFCRFSSSLEEPIRRGWLKCLFPNLESCEDYPEPAESFGMWSAGHWRSV